MITENELEHIRMDFPILSQKVNGHALVYLGNGATTQVPNRVLQTIVEHYHSDNANVHRGIHTLSERSTAALERAREMVRAYINAGDSSEVVFTKGTTDSINKVACMLESSGVVGEGDTVAVSALEHHSNFVPWQQLCARVGARFEVVPLDENLDVNLKAFGELLELGNVKVVAITHVSNVTGTVVPVKDIASRAHAIGALVLVDAAQSVRHEEVDVQEIGCDFLCFSGHKVCAPTGIGVLWGKRSLLDALSPIEFGGEMVDIVTTSKTTFEACPLRFEAGTPNFVGAVALGSALAYLLDLGLPEIREREHALIDYAEKCLGKVPGLAVLGKPSNRAGCLSFYVEKVHPFDVAKLLDVQGFALRSGNQCAQPLLHETCAVQGVTRLSPTFYNSFEEVERCSNELGRIIPMLQSAVR